MGFSSSFTLTNTNHERYHANKNFHQNNTNQINNPVIEEPDYSDQSDDLKTHIELFPEGRDALRKVGLTDEEIDLICSDPTKLKDIIDNINGDEKRRKELYERAVLNSLKESEYYLLSSAAIEKRIKEIDSTLKTIDDPTKNEIKMLRNMYYLLTEYNIPKDALCNYPVVWSREDENGKTVYSYNVQGNSPYDFEGHTYLEFFDKNSELYQLFEKFFMNGDAEANLDSDEYKGFLELLNQDIDSIKKSLEEEREKLLKYQKFEYHSKEFNSLNDVKEYIQELEEKIDYLNNPKDNEQRLIRIMAQMDNIPKENICNAVIVWSYEDENGKTVYTYSDPYENPSINKIDTIKSYSYNDLFDHSSDLYKLFEKYYINGKELTEFNEQEFNDFVNELKNDNSEKLRLLNEEREIFLSVADVIEKEAKYHNEYIDAYFARDDFNEKNGESSAMLNIVENMLNLKAEQVIGKRTPIGDSLYRLFLTVTDEETAALLGYLLNNRNNDKNIFKSATKEGNMFFTEEGINFVLSEDPYAHYYMHWLDSVSEDEIKVYNYLYNSEGAESALKYLKDISEHVDYVYVLNQRRKDYEWAEKNGILASIAYFAGGWLESIITIVPSLRGGYLTDSYNRTAVYKEAVVDSLPLPKFLGNMGFSIADSFLAGRVLRMLGEISWGKSFGCAAALIGSKKTSAILTSSMFSGDYNFETVMKALIEGTLSTIWSGIAISGKIDFSDHIKLPEPSIQMLNSAMSFGIEKTPAVLNKVSELLTQTIFKFFESSEFKGDMNLYNSAIEILSDDLEHGALRKFPILIKEAIKNGNSVEDAYRIALKTCSDIIEGDINASLIYNMLSNGGPFDKELYEVSNLIASSCKY